MNGLGTIIAIGIVTWVLSASCTWLRIDACLDGGGRWDYDIERCDLP